MYEPIHRRRKQWHRNGKSAARFSTMSVATIDNKNYAYRHWLINSNILSRSTNTNARSRCNGMALDSFQRQRQPKNWQLLPGLGWKKFTLHNIIHEKASHYFQQEIILWILRYLDISEGTSPGGIANFLFLIERFLYNSIIF